MTRRKRSALSIPLPLALGLLIASLIVFLVLAWPVLGPRILKEETTSASAGSLTAMRTMSDLQTLSWVRRTVFPHDFYLPDTTYNQLLLRDKDSLSAAEEIHLSAASLAWDMGLALSRGERGFVVVTSVVEFGYDLAELTVEPGVEGFTITLPAAEMMTITIEDIDRQAYAFGAVPIDADEWRDISAFVREQIQADPEAERLAEEARQNAIEVLEALFASEDRPIQFIR